MKRLAVIALALPGLAGAQWSSFASSPTIFANAAGDQVQPKLKATTYGNAFLTWKDNQGGGYDVRAQYINGPGQGVWGAGGVLLADRSYSSTQDYDMAVSNDEWFYVIFRDDRSGLGTHVTVQMVDGTGTVGWETTLTAAVGSYSNPKVCVLQDGTLATGWSTSSGFSMRRLDANGAMQGTQVNVSEAGRTIVLSDLESGAGDQAIALWIRPFNTSFLSSKYLYCQKYDAAGNTYWNTGAPLQLYAPTGSPYGSQGGSVQNGYYPTIVPDEQGGFACAWYENAGPRHAYVQHIDAQGNKLMGTWGTPIATTAGRMQLGASLAYDSWTETYYVAAVEADITPETNYSVIAQRHDASGARIWGDSAVTVKPINGFQKSFVQAAMTSDGPNVFGFDATSATNHVVFKCGVNAGGGERFGVTAPSLVSDLSSTKSRLFTDLAPHGGVIAAWGDGPFGSVDIHGARIQQSGALGNVGTELSGSVAENVTYLAAYTKVPWTVELIGASGSETHRLFCSASQSFLFRTELTGTVDVYVRGPHWLRNFAGTIDLSAPIAFGANLINGDVDGDNEVGPGDFAALAASFGTVPGDAGWMRNADLDGDLEVGPNDFAIMSFNFGLTGD